MNVRIHSVSARDSADDLVEHLAQLRSSDDLLLLSCTAGSIATTPSGLVGLWWPLYGTALAQNTDSRISIDRRSIFVSDPQRGHDILFQTCSGGFGLVGSQAAWAKIISLSPTTAAAEVALFPALHPARSSVCRQLLRFLRAASKPSAESKESSPTILLGAAVEDMQRPFSQLIARCPGRSRSRQKTVFMRLQRVRNYLASCTQSNLDVRRLAMMANYSVWRFIRVYFSVFGETPYAHVSRCRLDRARKLLEASHQCVSEIALAVGFESRSTLTRAMKKRYGVSSTQARLLNSTDFRVRTASAK